MAKRTKTMKKRLARDLFTKARGLFTEGLITAKEFENIQRLSTRVMNKL